MEGILATMADVQALTRRLAKRMDSESTSHASAESGTSKVREALQRLDVMSAAKESALAEGAERHRRLNAEVADLEMERDRTLSIHTRLLRKLAETNAAYERCKSRKAELGRALDDLRSQVSTQFEKVKVAEVRSLSAHKDVKSVEERVTAARRDLASLKSRMSAAQIAFRQAQAKRAAAEQQLEQLTKHSADMEKRAQTSATTMRAVLQEHTRLMGAAMLCEVRRREIELRVSKADDETALIRVRAEETEAALRSMRSVQPEAQAATPLTKRRLDGNDEVGASKDMQAAQELTDYTSTACATQLTREVVPRDSAGPSDARRGCRPDPLRSSVSPEPLGSSARNSSARSTPRRVSRRVKADWSRPNQRLKPRLKIIARGAEELRSARAPKPPSRRKQRRAEAPMLQLQAIDSGAPSSRVNKLTTSLFTPVGTDTDENGRDGKGAADAEDERRRSPPASRDSRDSRSTSAQSSETEPPHDGQAVILALLEDDDLLGILPSKTAEVEAPKMIDEAQHSSEAEEDCDTDVAAIEDKALAAALAAVDFTDWQMQ